MRYFNLDRFQLKHKLLIQNLTVVSFISLVIILFFPRTQNAIALDRSKDYLKTFRHTTSITVQDAVEFLDKESCDLLLDHLSNITTIDFIALFTANDKLFTTLNDSSFQVFLSDVPNFRSLFNNQQDSIIQWNDRLLIFSDIIKEEKSGSLLISFKIDDVIESTKTAYTVAILITLFSILLSVLLSSLLSKPISVPIIELITFFKSMADGKGDLTKRLPATSQDEFGTLAREFNRFLEAQNALIHDIKNVVQVVDERIGSIETLSENNNYLISQLSNTFGLISNNAYSVYKGASLNVESAQNVTERSETTINKSIQTQKAADKSINLMEEIKDEVSQLEKDMTELHENSKKIRLISDTLKDIADRTTILALNTSIEANKAGDTGAGFLIIAQEIQNLAEQSTNSLDSINKLNRMIQSGLDQSFQLTVASAKRVEEGMENIEETGNHIIESAGSVQDNLEHIQEVLKIAKEQQTQIKTIVQNIDQSSDNLNTIRQSVNNTLSSVKDQKQLLNNLSRLMDNFKVAK